MGGPKVGEDSENAAVTVVRLDEAELEEHVADVALDCPLADHQAPGNRLVVQPLRACCTPQTKTEKSDATLPLPDICLAALRVGEDRERAPWRSTPRCRPRRPARP